MQRITTNVDREVYARLEDPARRRDIPASRLIREALARYVSEEAARAEPGPLPEWVGMLEGPGGAYAEVAEELIAEGWAAELEPRPRSRQAGG